MAELLQFPNRIHTPVHAVRNGEPWWVYKAEYFYKGETEMFYFWARDEHDAKQRLAVLASTATFVGRLRDIMEKAGELPPQKPVDKERPPEEI
jgi:hypothetical protein